jgi:RNA polymerase sigma factor (sigma-70 family)
MIRIAMTMSVSPPDAMDLEKIDSCTLVYLCAHNLEDAELWSEFLRRFTPKIKRFIQVTLNQYTGSHNSATGGIDSTQGSSDLLQNTILRLVQNQCAALRRFSGTTESELSAYLAVIARSVVRDSIRHQSAKRRFHWFAQAIPAQDREKGDPDPAREPGVEDLIDRRVLATEIEQLSLEAIRDNSDEPGRDELIFQLYFIEGLSTAQIASCKGIGLSKTGVEKMLNRLKDRVRNKAGVDAVEARP